MLSLIQATQAGAAVWCSGTVTNVYVDVNGYLTVDWGFQPILLCNLNVDATLPSPQATIGYKTCQSVYSTALTAQSTAKNFMVLLQNDNSCSGLFSGGWIATKYISAFRIGTP
jgi:hypothetical protein